MKLAILLILLSGCAAVETVSTAKETFAVCRGLDLVTTKVALNMGFTEGNPVASSLLKHGWLPLIGLNVFLIWLAFSHWDNFGDTEKKVVNFASCFPPLWNGSQIAHELY